MLTQIRPAIVSVLAMTVITGLIFPGMIYAIGQLAFPYQANGSLIKEGNQIIGSELIGQNFAKAEYFHPRPSAAGSGYDAGASSGTNLGPTSKKLIEGLPDDPKTKDVDESFAGIPQLTQAYRKENNLPADAPVPGDAVTRSASGVDPHISPENAAIQAKRIAIARKIEEAKVMEAIAKATTGRGLGILGETTVNVTLANRALDGK
jgi:K+-transporting ATPase ATPase C chain